MCNPYTHIYIYTHVHTHTHTLTHRSPTIQISDVKISHIQIYTKVYDYLYI